MNDTNQHLLGVLDANNWISGSQSCYIAHLFDLDHVLWSLSKFLGKLCLQFLVKPAHFSMVRATLNSKTSQMSALSHVPMPAWTGTKGSCFGLFARDEPDEAASRLEAKLCAYLGKT